MPQQFNKDPSEVLDYEINWDAEGWLSNYGSDTIATSTWTVPTGITKNSDTHTTTTTTIWLAGGTLGAVYEVTNQIVTVGGRTSERTLTFNLVKK